MERTNIQRKKEFYEILTLKLSELDFNLMSKTEKEKLDFLDDEYLRIRDKLRGSEKIMLKVRESNNSYNDSVLLVTRIYYDIGEDKYCFILSSYSYDEKQKKRLQLEEQCPFYAGQKISNMDCIFDDNEYLFLEWDFDTFMIELRELLFGKVEEV